MRLLESLENALLHVDLADTDEAAVELARAYATELDTNPRRLGTLGPALLRVLEELHLTPKARATIKKEARDAGSRSALDELKAKRAARVNGSATVDAPAS